MPPRPSSESPFGRTVLVAGPEGLLAERAVDDLRRRALEECGDDRPEITDVDAGSVDAGELAEMTGASLFSSRSVAIIRNLADLSQDLFDAVTALAQGTPEEVALILVHNGGNKGSGLLTKLKKAKIEVIDCPAIKQWDLPQFTANEARRHGTRMDPDAAQQLAAALGNDVRAIAAGVSQLVSDAPGEPITVPLVKRYFAGRTDVTAFTIVDDTLEGNTGKALENLRWGLESGMGGPALTGAFANNLRLIARYAAERGRGGDNQIAAALGVSPFQLKKAATHSRRWDEAKVAEAIAEVARADAEVKGAAAASDFVLERLVLTLSSRANQRRR